MRTVSKRKSLSEQMLAMLEERQTTPFPIIAFGLLHFDPYTGIRLVAGNGDGKSGFAAPIGNLFRLTVKNRIFPMEGNSHSVAKMAFIQVPI